jgi:hypothetical protein
MQNLRTHYWALACMYKIFTPLVADTDYESTISIKQQNSSSKIEKVYNELHRCPEETLFCRVQCFIFCEIKK